jgi:hypothetical protein
MATFAGAVVLLPATVTVIVPAAVLVAVAWMPLRVVTVLVVAASAVITTVNTPPLIEIVGLAPSPNPTDIVGVT